MKAAAAKHQEALDQLGSLLRLESVTRWLTPAVFVVGLLLVGALAAVTRGHRRLLGIERARAVHDSLHDALTGLPNRTLLADRLGQALRADVRADTRTGLLLLEVTESALMAEPVRAQRLLGELSALGVRLSIDNFGAGYTSLSHLKTLPAASSRSTSPSC